MHGGERKLQFEDSVNIELETSKLSGQKKVKKRISMHRVNR
jgi:hypothetical protein